MLTVTATLYDGTTHARLPNVRVEATHANGTVLTGVTNASGICRIALPLGEYSVRVFPPDGYGVGAGTPARITVVDNAGIAMDVIVTRL